MFPKNRILFFIVTITLLLFSVSAFAESPSVSLGVPVIATFENSWNSDFGDGPIESSSVDGLIIHYRFPAMFGIL